MAQNIDFGGQSLSDGQQVAAENAAAQQQQQQQPQAPVAPEAPAPAPADPAAAAGHDPNDPVFQSLPREIQKLVEGGMPLDKAVQKAANQGGQAGAPAPNADNAPAIPLNAGPKPNAQGQPNVPAAFATDPNRLSAGQVLEGGRSGRDTFARPGSQGFQAFSGQEFNPFLLRPEARGLAGGAALSARDALNTGEAGRNVLSSGGASGFNLGGGDDPFLKDLGSG